MKRCACGKLMFWHHAFNWGFVIVCAVGTTSIIFLVLAWSLR